MNLTLRIQAIATVFFLSISSGMADENKSVPIEVKSMGDYEAMDKAARSGDSPVRTGEAGRHRSGRRLPGI